jgi:hypothetical protein
MAEPVTIREPDVKDDSLDLNTLKKQGLDKIQELSGNNWTDFNFHDPGVTILEILCYALTDLAYRADFDVRDLLNTAGRKKIQNSLFPADKILITGPISFLDFKRLLLDMEGVKNCDIQPAVLDKVIRGLFDVYIEIHPDFDTADFREKTEHEVRSLLDKKRPVGIQFNEVIFFQHQPIGISIDLELNDDVDPKNLFIEFVKRVQDYFSPEIKFRSLQELIDLGLSSQEIFNGPLLQNGFLTATEVQQNTMRQRIFTSDLMSMTMAIPGVSFIRELKVIADNDEEFNWICEVKQGCVPRIDPLRTKFICRYRNTVVFENKKESVELWSSARLNRSSSHKQNTIEKDPGVSRNLKKYHSIQNDFPETYGIGPKGPSAGASDEKLAAIKQFKGYLFTYDQVMANFLAQLDHVKYLFSTEDIQNTYAVQLIDDIPGIEFLYKQFIEHYYVIHNNFNNKLNLKTEWSLFLKHYREHLTAEVQSKQETEETFLRRRNNALDHLLARFGIDTLKLELLADLNQREAISYKLDLLRYFPLISSERFSGGPSSLVPGISGIKCWIARNLHFRGAEKNEITLSISDNSNPSHTGNEQIRIDIQNRNKPLNVLLKNGVDPENLVPVAENLFNVIDDDGLTVARITVDKEIRGDAKETVLKKLRDLDEGSENLFIVDHLDLHPTPDLSCFGFDVLLNGVPFFSSERKYTLKGCETFLEEFTERSRLENSFSVFETDHREFKIRFNGNNGALLTRSFFSTAKEAREQLEFFIHTSGKKELEFNFHTSFEDHFINLQNPFSHVVTVLLPTWPSRFQKEGYRKYIEEFIYEEFPAHLAVNIKWLDFEDMKNFEEQLREYSAASQTNHSTKKLEALEKFMNTLAS